MNADQSAEVINAGRMMEQQRRFGVPHDFCDFPSQLAIGNAYTLDRQCHDAAPENRLQNLLSVAWCPQSA
jgi:hypothetical protein